ncbi:Efflux ABC transporter, ATP-binding protein [hydrothermal vent metagenome]|uniref:Efflux ABC transporter, ATP-binding protein n=1 Tax=hydrothermal vent metagenome TaxID=652676 RepID=A0A3B0VBN3_9ZZZZ
MNNAVAIRCQGLSKQYGEVAALKPLDLTVTAGSIFGFLGRNGAGKTTTIRLLTGLAQPSSGTAWVAGVETTVADSGARSQFGYLPQEPAFYGWMTPLEYLDYVGKLFQMDKPTRQRRIDEMLTLVSLTEAAKRPIRGFSGGMIQRLGLAQALLHEPPVLFLDEPTSSLDPAGRYELLALLESLRGRVTIFLSSHILADVERVCDTIGIIREGELVVVAARDALLAQYATDTVLLEIAPASVTAVSQFIPVLQAQDWVQQVELENGRLHIHIHDVAQAQQALLPLVVENQVQLNKFEWKRPSLEEIFLSISSQ